MYRDRRFILLHIIKILQQMTLQQTFIMSRFLFTSELFKTKQSNNQLSCSIVVCEVLKYHHLAFILTLLTSDSAVTNNRRWRGRPTEMKNHT